MCYYYQIRVVHLLPALVRAFREMGFSITAEDGETQKMAETMAVVCCDCLQGFLYSRPFPAEECTAE